MSHSSHRIVQINSSKHQRITERDIPRAEECQLIEHSGGINELVYASVKYPTEIGFQDLVEKKNVLYELLRQFEKNKGDRVIFDQYKTQDYFKRLTLLEKQIEGLMNSKLIYEKGQEGTAQGRRILDYSNFISEKQNQVIQLERKIAYYDKKFRTDEHRVRQLQDQITRLHSIILDKNRLIENLQGKHPQEWKADRQAMGYAERLISQMQKAKRSHNLSMGQVEGVVQAWILQLPQSSSNLRQKLKAAQLRLFNERKYRDYVLNKLGTATRLYKSQIDSLSSIFGDKKGIYYDNRLLETLSIDDSGKDQLLNHIFDAFIHGPGYENYEKQYMVSKVVQVPVQDARTKALIHKLALQMNKLYRKYPALSKEIDPRLAEFFSQQMIDIIGVDEVDRLVEIVKIQPQIIKVDNVYTYSKENNRKVQFHLRVLIKALLEEFQKLKAKTGIDLEIDDGILTMVRQEIVDIADIEDVLCLFRAVPKIVEVEKVIEKVVQRIIEVPKFVTAETRVENPVQVKRYEVVQNTINVPVQHPVITPMIQEKLVVVPQIRNTVIPTPQIHEHAYQTIVERPRVVQVDNVVTLDKQVPKIVEMPGPERVVQIPMPEVIQCIREVIVETRQETQRIKQVEKIVQKVVEIVREVPKIVEVQRIVTKTVPVKEYLESQRVINHVSQRYEPVELIVEKIVPICRVEERIVQVPQIIQKIVPVIEYRTECIEVECIRQKPVYQTQLKIVEKIKQVPVVEIREVQKIVQKIIEVPVIHQKVIIERQYIKEPVIETVEKVIHKEVQLQKPKILYEDRIVEVDRIINHSIETPQIINIERETLVPYQTVVDRIIPHPTIVEKIIEKIVEVPRVVEVEKIIQKIVTIPRIIEKIVQVEKIVEKIVQQVVFQEKIVEKECRVQVPVFHERLIEVERPVNYYQRVEVPVEVREQVMVRDTITTTVPEIYEIQQPPRIVVETRQVDVPMIVEKICTLRTIDNKYVQLKEVEIIPVQIQLPIDLIKEKIVPIQHVRTQIQVQNAIIEKIVRVEAEMQPRVIQVERREEVLRVEKDFQVVQNRIPYYQDRILEVQCIVEKIIDPVYYEVEKIVTVPTIVDKIVEKIVNIPKIYEIERRNDVIVKDPTVIRIQKIVPQLVTLNKSVESIVDRIVEVPRLLEKLNIVNQSIERIVPQTSIETRIEQVQILQQREVIYEKIKEVQNKIHLISEVMQLAQRVIERPTEPVIICEDRIMQVPFIVEKIVEKITIYPQVVEVLKYVHEIMEKDTLTEAVCNSVQEVEYTNLGRNLNLEVNKLKNLLVSLKESEHGHGHGHGNSREIERQIVIIENFLAQFHKFIIYPRIREVIAEKTVDKVIEKSKLVTIPVESSESSQRGLASAVLIDKLVNQLRRFKKANPNMKWQLDDDIMSIFGVQLQPISQYYGNDYQKILNEYERVINHRFSSVGEWTPDHQEMIKSFINERFDLAYNYKRAMAESAKTKARYQSVLTTYSKMKQHNQRMKKSFDVFTHVFPLIIEEGRRQNRIDQRTQSKFNQAFQGLSSLVFGFALHGAKTHQLQPIDNQRVRSMLREKQEEIIRLKDQIRQILREGHNHHHHSCERGIVDRSKLWDESKLIREKDQQIYRLKERIRQLQSRLHSLEFSIKSSSKSGHFEEQEKLLQKLREKDQECFRLIGQLKIEKQYRERYIIIERQNRELERQIQRLRIIEGEHRGCQSHIDSLKAEINKLRIQISNVKSPKGSRGTKPSVSPRGRGEDVRGDSSDGSLYGVNYLQYTNIDQNESETRIERGVYRSGNYDQNSRRDLGGYSQQNYNSHYMTSSNQSGGTGQSLGTSSRRVAQNSYQSGYAKQLSSGQGGEYQSQYSKGSIPSRQKLQTIQARYESSDRGDSQVYISSSKKSVDSSTRRFQRSGYERKE